MINSKKVDANINLKNRKSNVIKRLKNRLVHQINRRDVSSMISKLSINSSLNVMIEQKAITINNDFGIVHQITLSNYAKALSRTGLVDLKIEQNTATEDIESVLKAFETWNTRRIASIPNLRIE